MKCFKCMADMEPATTVDVTEVNDCLIIIRNVPCFKCSECDEIFYTAKVMKQLEMLIEAAKKLTIEITVLDYSKQIA